MSIISTSVASLKIDKSKADVGCSLGGNTDPGRWLHINYMVERGAGRGLMSSITTMKIIFVSKTLPGTGQNRLSRLSDEKLAVAIGRERPRGTVTNFACTKVRCYWYINRRFVWHKLTDLLRYSSSIGVSDRIPVLTYETENSPSPY